MYCQQIIEELTFTILNVVLVRLDYQLCKVGNGPVAPEAPEAQ